MYLMFTREISSGVLQRNSLIAKKLKGSLAGLVGAFGAVVVSFGISRFLFDLPYQGNVMLWVAGVLMSVVLVVGASLAAIRSDLNTPPWQTLRDSD